MTSWDSALGDLQRAALAVFGDVDVTYYPSAAREYELEGGGIFRAPHAEVLVGPVEQSVSTSSPTIDVRLSDLQAPPRSGGRDEPHDELVVHFKESGRYGYTGDVRFRVWDDQPDGEGMTRLLLHRRSDA